MKIKLENEMETLIIPLYGKAKMSQIGIFHDPYAEEMIKKINYNYSKLKIQQKTQVMLAMRAAILDNFAKDFINKNPGCTVLHLGCGLDARFMRLDPQVEIWYDLDFPEVIEIKKMLLSENEHYKFISSSVTESWWIDSMPENINEVLVIAEGLLMYLTEDEIKNLFIGLKSKFKNLTIIFDAYSKLTARSAKNHPSLKKTGAEIKWGVDKPQEIESFADGIKHLKTIYLTDPEVTNNLPKSYRIMFSIAGLFKSAREAHRVFVMSIKQEKP
jgi:O-methyltransferase involved in polyketide biosynthesis